MIRVDLTTISRLFGEQLRSLPIKRTIYIGGKQVWTQQFTHMME